MNNIKIDKSMLQLEASLLNKNTGKIEKEIIGIGECNDDAFFLIEDDAKSIARLLNGNYELFGEKFSSLKLDNENAEKVRKYFNFPELANGAQPLAYDSESKVVLANFRNELVTWKVDSEGNCNWGDYYNKNKFDAAFSGFLSRSEETLGTSTSLSMSM